MLTVYWIIKWMYDKGKKINEEFLLHLWKYLSISFLSPSHLLFSSLWLKTLFHSLLYCYILQSILHIMATLFFLKHFLQQFIYLLKDIQCLTFSYFIKSKTTRSIFKMYCNLNLFSSLYPEQCVDLAYMSSYIKMKESWKTAGSKN